MGQTPKPMRVYVTERGCWNGILSRVEREKPVEMHLTLRPNTLLMGPGCHRLLPGMEKYAEVAVKAARTQYTPVLKPVKPKVK